MTYATAPIPTTGPPVAKCATRRSPSSAASAARVPCCSGGLNDGELYQTTTGAGSGLPAVLGPLQSARAFGSALPRLRKISLASPGLLSPLLFVEIRLDEAWRDWHRVFVRCSALCVDSRFPRRCPLCRR